MKKKIISLFLCLVLLLAIFHGLPIEPVNAASGDNFTGVIAKDMTISYPGDFGTPDNPNQNRVYFNISADLKAGQYVNFTVNSPVPISNGYSFVYDCNGTNGLKFAGWVGGNPGVYRFSVQIPEDTNWLDLVMYTELGVPKGTEITLSDITVSNVKDVSGIGPGYFEFGVNDGVVPFTANKGDVITFDLDVINGTIPNRGGNSTCIWVWQNGDVGKLLHGNVYTTPEGQQQVQVCATEDITGLRFSIDVQNVPTDQQAVAIVSNMRISDWHDDNRMVNFKLEPYEKCVVDGNDYYYTVPAGTDITALAPTFSIASDASVDKASGSVQDFTNSVTYTVTSAQNRHNSYIVHVYALDQIFASDQVAVQAITNRANALPDKIAAVDTALLQEATQLKTDYEALTILQKMLIDDDVKDKIMQMAQKAEDAVQPIRITCVGDSITQGVGADNQDTESYPAQLQTILGSGYEVFNAGVSGARVLADSNKPYTETERYMQGLEFNPNIVIIMLGTNDAYGDYSDTVSLLMQKFEHDYKAIVEAYQNLATKPKIFVALPPTCYETVGGRTDNLKAYLNPLLAVYAEANNFELIDMFAFTAEHADWFPDALHPSTTAYTEIAKEFSKYILSYGEAKLTSLSVNGIEVPEFANDKHTYEMGLPIGTTSLNITAIASQQDAEILIESSNPTLPAEVTIAVTSGDGHARNVYKIGISEVGLEEIKAQIEAACNELTISNATTVDDIMAVVNKYIEGSGITAMWSMPFTKKDAREGVEGNITGKICLTTIGEKEQIVTLNLRIPALQTEQESGGQISEKQEENQVEINQEEMHQSSDIATGDTKDIAKYIVVLVVATLVIIISNLFKTIEEYKGDN